MSKLWFRARPLDAAKPLPVYRSGDLPDLADLLSVSRTVPQMPTGMEKEEELEHHLQRALSAPHAFQEKQENLVIPVPKAESAITDYERLYGGDIRAPKQLIRVQTLGLEQPDYDLDSEDEVLLSRLSKQVEIQPLQFEAMMERLEKASTQQLVSLSEARLLLEEDDYLLKTVFDYWLRKRRSCLRPSLIPHVRQERRDGSTNGDAYVAFRRRREKMQTRKNRKNDEASYEKMLRLRNDFRRSITILEMIERREKSKRELLHLSLEVLEKRYHMGDFGGEALRAVSVPLVEKPVYCAVTQSNSRNLMDMKMKKGLSVRHQLLSDSISTVREKLSCSRRRPRFSLKQYDFHSSGEDDAHPPQVSLWRPGSPLGSCDPHSQRVCPPWSSDDEENTPDGVFVFRRRAGCQYLSPSAPLVGGVSHAGRRPQHAHLALSELPPGWTGYARRRIGRGGRVIVDRASSGLVLTPHTCRAATRDSPPLEQSASLTHVLNNIQNLSRFCYRARPGQGPQEHRGRSSGQSSSSCAPSTCASGGITEAQYHHHQQQLLQMQKEQLQTQRSRATKSPGALQPAQTSRTSASSSRPLDRTSAQFAASAVVGAAPPNGHMTSRMRASSRSCVKGGARPSGPSRCGPALCRLSVQLPLPPSSPYSLATHRLSAAPPASAGLALGPRVSAHLSRDEPDKRLTMMPMEVT